MLVDDWENVTKNQQLVPLPHPHPVAEILRDYLAWERPHRQEGSASVEVLEETVAGIHDYFEKCLGRILLYRYLRSRYRIAVHLADLPAIGSSAINTTRCTRNGALEPTQRTRVLLTRMVQSTCLACSVAIPHSPPCATLTDAAQSLFRNLLHRQTWINSRLTACARSS